MRLPPSLPFQRQTPHSIIINRIYDIIFSFTAPKKPLRGTVRATGKSSAQVSVALANPKSNPVCVSPHIIISGIPPVAHARGPQLYIEALLYSPHISLS